MVVCFVGVSKRKRKVGKVESDVGRNKNLIWWGEVVVKMMMKKGGFDFN